MTAVTVALAAAERLAPNFAARAGAHDLDFQLLGAGDVHREIT